MDGMLLKHPVAQFTRGIKQDFKQDFKQEIKQEIGA
jgi:hypothetical protein